ncbi:hypothetical protein CIL03_00770 [Virgibacillus indicus]|uniref:Transcription initiation factor TFIIIB n=1 Tax=Virgibacillus indicus TaxID=2024554 RepID=A0A265NEJ6_9BACI|nr:hypothetical protein [Virgibacillus indicus]OZU89706.1 hypothetical protein CIL03_00770 [Virgibacillus indicus]
MELSSKNECPKCNGNKFAEGTDFMNIRPLGKKMSVGTGKIYTFCLNCGEVISTRVENPEKFKDL